MLTLYHSYLIKRNNSEKSFLTLVYNRKSNEMEIYYNRPNVFLLSNFTGYYFQSRNYWWYLPACRNNTIWYKKQQQGKGIKML